jgi:ATP-dependent helicase/DNAse subunit B
MEQDKYSAFWISHSSISDYLKCPRLYFLKNVYREPENERKISLITAPMALGQAVHDVLETMSFLPAAKRFTLSPLKRLEVSWQKIEGEKGGFENSNHEKIYKERAEKMIKNIVKNPGPLNKLAVKIKDKLPNYFISKKNSIVLCGKIDWLEYLKKSDTVHIIDFKTGRGTEDDDSLQLPIYHLLVHNCQERQVKKASLWYLEKHRQPKAKKLADLEIAHKKVLKIGKKMQLAKKLNKLECPQGREGCQYCLPYEKIAKGEGKLVGINDYGANVDILKKPKGQDKITSELL